MEKLKRETLALLENDGDKTTTTRNESEYKPIPYYKILLPAPVEISDLRESDIQLAPEIIRGVLRRKHKLILTGPSKAGKSFAMLELVVAIATGGKWLGFQCEKGKVLYVNLELDEESCLMRLKTVCTTLNAWPEENSCFVWNLRGFTVPFTELAPRIAKIVKEDSFDLVIIDPIYKCFDGSENEQESVAKFCNSLDLICEAGASVVYTHHHSKGTQGHKDIMDRGSGSGVFSRDADAILDLMPLYFTGDAPIDPKDPSVTAWQLDGVLREFRAFQPKRLYFRYPLHEVCENDSLDKAKPKTKQSFGGEARKAQIEMEDQQKKEAFKKAFLELCSNDESVHKNDLAEKLGVSSKTVLNRAKRFGYPTAGGQVFSKGGITGKQENS